MLGKIAEDEGASGVTLHARTVEQLYERPRTVGSYLST